MLLGKFNFAAVLLTFSMGAFAQGVFEGSGEEDNGSCVGDGCGIEIPPQEEVSDQQNVSENETSDTLVQAQNQQADSSQTDSTTAKIGAKSTDGENGPNVEDEDDGRENYVNESASEYAARKEGFSKTLQFGIRAGGGASFMLGKKADGWGLGFEGNLGITGRLPLYRRTIGLQMELDFSYRQYNYEKSTSYSDNDATIDEILFEFPVMMQYTFDDEGFFVNFGVNLGLKMSSESTFHQAIDTDDVSEKRKSSNTLPTVGVEVGAVLDLGYSITRWMNIDLRVVQSLNNILDMDLIAESTVMGSKLFPLHTTLGISFLI